WWLRWPYGARSSAPAGGESKVKGGEGIASRLAQCSLVGYNKYVGSFCKYLPYGTRCRRKYTGPSCFSPMPTLWNPIDATVYLLRRPCFLPAACIFPIPLTS